VVQAGLGRKGEPISKITRAKMAGGMAQVVEYLPSKCKAPPPKKKVSQGPV
jgi:hypothetical protein